MSDEKRKSKKRIYISGPMQDVPDYEIRFWAFADAIRQTGRYSAVNPAGFKVIDNDGGQLLSREDWLEIDLKTLEKCDAIFMMPGWENSKGAVMEYKKAKELKLEIYGFVSA